MKQTLSLFLLLLLVKTGFAQNVGIGTTNPQTKLDINGDIAFHSADITIASTYSYNLDVNTTKQTNYKLKASLLPPLGNFIIAGIASGADGRMITLNNRTGFSMEIYNEDINANAENRIQTGTGSTVAVYPNGNVTLQYDATDQRWSIKSMHNNSLNYFGGGGSSTSYWDLSGTDIGNNNSGNVGIGTTSPVFKLDVRGKTHVQGNVLSGNGSTGGGFEIATTGIGTQSQYLNFDGQRIQSLGSPNIQTAASPKDFLINPFGGKVGIGLTSPRCKLTVLSTTVLGNNNTEVLQMAGKNPVMWISDVNGTDHGYIKGVTDNSITPQFPGVGLEIGAAPGFDLYLSANYSPALTVSHNNNVGIGSTNPGSPLSFSNILGKKISFWSNGANSDFGIGIQNGEMQFYTAGQDIISFGYGSSGSYNRSMAYYPGTAQLGINCLPQAGFNLAVNGFIKAKEIQVSVNNWADYVFSNDYKLMPLQEVETFVKRYNHLPGVADAATLQSKGMDVSKMQTVMMEKIEELTLYIIDLNKEIEKLKNKK